MEPIISPWLIYLIGIMSNLRVIVSIAAALFLLAALIAALSAINGQGAIIPKQKRLLKIARRLCCVVVFFAVIIVCIPSTNTCIAMIVANEVTYDRVHTAMDTGPEVVAEIKQDILDLIKAAKEKE